MIELRGTNIFNRSFVNIILLIGRYIVLIKGFCLCLTCVPGRHDEHYKLFIITRFIDLFTSFTGLFYLLAVYLIHGDGEAGVTVVLRAERR